MNNTSFDDKQPYCHVALQHPVPARDVERFRVLKIDDEDVIDVMWDMPVPVGFSCLEDYLLNTRLKSAEKELRANPNLAKWCWFLGNSTCLTGTDDVNQCQITCHNANTFEVEAMPLGIPVNGPKDPNIVFTYGENVTAALFFALLEIKNRHG